MLTDIRLLLIHCINIPYSVLYDLPKKNNPRNCVETLWGINFKLQREEYHAFQVQKTELL